MFRTTFSDDDIGLDTYEIPQSCAHDSSLLHSLYLTLHNLTPQTRAASLTRILALSLILFNSHRQHHSLTHTLSLSHFTQLSPAAFTHALSLTPSFTLRNSLSNSFTHSRAASPLPTLRLDISGCEGEYKLGRAVSSLLIGSHCSVT